VSVDAALDWLTSLPHISLYLALAVAAAIENVFPPIPADTIAAFGSFLTARGAGNPLIAFPAVLTGNVGSALGTYAIGRRLSPDRVEYWLERLGGEGAAARLRQLHQRHGAVALFLSRFVPGLRALVPPFAGALHTPWPTAITVITVASAVWYGGIMWVAYTLGARWREVEGMVGSMNRIAAIAAGAVALTLVIVWLLRRRKSNA